MSLKQVQWSPPISCDTCLQYFTSVYFDQLFVATVSDHAGCENSDEVFIKVNQRRNVFIPNVFSPNADGENDKFQIFADYDLERISLFRVFDRWGELLYEERDALPGNNQGWDGSFRGQMMPPGVYAWMAVLTFKGGATEQYAGDLTVLR
jgi:gliding motility-associated-like protein